MGSRALAIGTGLATIGVVVAGALIAKRASAEPETDDDSIDDEDGDELVDIEDSFPTEDDVEGDYESNWGETPRRVRPLFLLMEDISGIVGSARLFSVIAFGESGWKTRAQNNRSNEVSSSRSAYTNGRERGNPELKYGNEAAEFGSGGLFGALAPYFLWTGVPEIGKRAPLLTEHPHLMFRPRYAAFAAIVYLKRLVRGGKLADHLDVKAGWARPRWLDTKNDDGYFETRQKFSQHAAEVGINLNDYSTIPPKLDASRFPGVLETYERIVG